MEETQEDMNWLHSGDTPDSMSSAGTASCRKKNRLWKNLARRIIRASFSQERMQYLNQEGKVIYTAKVFSPKYRAVLIVVI